MSAQDGIALTVRYFAVFREQRGLSEETISAPPCTAGKLYERLAAAHGFTLPPSLVRAAVNRAFVPAETVLRDGDEVVFVPPVAGG